MTPAIHAAMWTEFGAALPSDANLAWELVRNRSFTDHGAREFIANYRATLAQADLDKSVVLRDNPPEGSNDDSEDDQTDDELVKSDERRDSPRLRQRDRKPGVVTISLPLPAFGADQPAVIEFPGKLDEADWDYFVAVLSAMKAGVVRRPGEVDED